MTNRRPKIAAALPPKCSVCASKQREKIDRALKLGESCGDVAGRYNVSRSVLQRHRAKHLCDVPRPGTAADGTTTSAVVTKLRPADATPLERAKLNADEALESLRRGEALGLPTKDLASLRNALTAAERFYASLASKTLTPEAIMKHPAFAALLEEIGTLLDPYPEAARAVMEGLQR